MNNKLNNSQINIIKFSKNINKKMYYNLIDYLKTINSLLMQKWINGDSILEYIDSSFIYLNDNNDRYILYKNKEIVKIENFTNFSFSEDG